MHLTRNLESTKSGRKSKRWAMVSSVVSVALAATAVGFCAPANAEEVPSGTGSVESSAAVHFLPGTPDQQLDEIL